MVEWVKKKTGSTIHYLWETNFSLKDMHKLKMNVCKKTFQKMVTKNKTGLDKIGFNLKMIKRDKIITQRSLYQEDNNYKYVWPNIGATKYIKQKLTKLKG